MERFISFSLLCLSPSLIQVAAVFAECYGGKDGMIMAIKVRSCEKIVATSNPDVQKYAGNLLDNWNLKKLYTGALIKNESGTFLMYPSDAQDPCTEFPEKRTVSKKIYSTCCDTGRWGKCVFGGNFLGDLNGKPINAFQ